MFTIITSAHFNFSN